MNRSFWSLRKKLAVFSLILLSIPFVSIRFLQQIETVLVDNLLQGLASYGHSIAFTLGQNDADFTRPVLSNDDIQSAMYIPSQEPKIEIDGYDDDWLSLLGFSRVYRSSEELSNTDFSMTLASQDNHLLLRVRVNDSSPSLREVNTQSLMSDKVVVRLIVNKDQFVSLTFSPVAMGILRPFVEKHGMDNFWVSSAQWQSHATGYLLEVKIPNLYRWQRLGVTVVNYDANLDRVFELPSYEAQENSLLWPSLALEKQLKQLLVEPGKRIWLLDRSGHVLARTGSLDHQLDVKPVNPLIHFLFSPASGSFVDPRSRAIELTTPQVEQALQGISSQAIESVGSSDMAIALVALPINSPTGVIGAVVIEETVAAVQLIQREVINSFMNSALTIMFLVITLMIVFASRITQRIMRLNRYTGEAIDRFGRVTRVFESEKNQDEIGELSRNFSNMSNRLKDYNDYMEKLAGRLTHELRTPVAMVRSSVDNIAFCDDPSIQPAIKNAQQGIERMSQMISRMSEAARLEHSISAVTTESIDIAQFCDDYLNAYRTVNEQFKIRLTLIGKPVPLSVSAELFAQVLDKLLANATDFAALNSEIEVFIEYDIERLTLAVQNDGPLLPSAGKENGLTDINGHQLFASMISQRSEEYRRADQANMGLGLYIVKLVAEFHQGDYFAKDRDDRMGVIVGISVPLK